MNAAPDGHWAGGWLRAAAGHGASPQEAGSAYRAYRRLAGQLGRMRRAPEMPAGTACAPGCQGPDPPQVRPLTHSPTAGTTAVSTAGIAGHTGTYSVSECDWYGNGMPAASTVQWGAPRFQDVTHCSMTDSGELGGHLPGRECVARQLEAGRVDPDPGPCSAGALSANCLC